jgi:predicted dehydrogenase
MDLMHYLLGDYSEILATTKIAYSQRPSVDNPGEMIPVSAEDCVMLLARMANGALGNIEATKIATGTEDELRFEIHGSQGALRFNTMDAHHLEVFDARVSDTPIGGMRGWTVVDTGQRYPKPGGSLPSPKNAIGWMRSHMACLYNFMASVHAGNPAEPGLEQGIYIQRLMECVRQSNISNSWEKV